MPGCDIEPHSDFLVLKAGQEHLDAMVQCHISCFPGQFMTLIGKRFIRGFYSFCISDTGGIALVALARPNRVVGLVAGGRPNMSTQFSLRRGILYLPDVLWASVKSHYARRRFLQHVVAIIKSGATRLIWKHRWNNRGLASQEPDGALCSLLSICTVSEFRRKGIGRALMESFRTECLSRGYKAMRLSVHSDNDVAVSLYKKCGWEIVAKTPKGIYLSRSVDQPS